MTKETLEAFSVAENLETGKYADKYTTITLAILKTDKAVYDDINTMTAKKFGKHLQAVIKREIDKVKGS